MKFIRQIFNTSLFAILFLALVSCEEEPVGQIPTDSTAPSAVKNVLVEPRPGGADIYYDVPDETDISYVECEYISENETKTTKASIYRNYVTVEGLKDTSPCKFTLYLVDHSENRSPAYSGSFTPMEPPYLTVFSTLKIQEDFGGAKFSWKNETNSPIGFYLLVKDDMNEWDEYDMIYSTQSSDSYSIRGYDSTPRQFGVVLTDRFGHYSDTLSLELTPLYEKLLNKKLFSTPALAGDNTTTHNARPITNIWDGNFSNLWHTNPSADVGVPQYFTIDFGVTAKLSRFVVYNRDDTIGWEYHNLRYFEVWGTNELKESASSNYYKDGSWKSDWYKIGDFEVVKPSGLPGSQSNADDSAAIEKGFEFEVPLDAPDFKYVRFVVNETWGKTQAIYMREISFYGNDYTEE